MPVCRHHFFKIQVYVLVDTDRCSSAFKRPSDIVLRWSDLTNPRADFFSFSSSSSSSSFFFFFFFFFWPARGARVPVPPPPGSATETLLFYRYRFITLIHFYFGSVQFSLKQKLAVTILAAILGCLATPAPSLVYFF